MRNMRKSFKWAVMLLLLLGACLIFVSPKKSACTLSANAGSTMFCCDFCYQQYEQCLNAGGSESTCGARLCACMVGCGVCPICE